jgi:exopolysaccharide production protein ExoQ
VALVATRSRGSLAAAGIGLAVVALTAQRRRRADVVLVTVVVAVAVWLVAATNIVTFLERGDSKQELDTLSGRTEVWGQAWELFQEKPLLGHGFMSARGAFLEKFRLGGAHNAFVEVLVNSGLFGIGWWIALLVLCVRGASRLVRSRHPDGPIVAGLVGALLGSTLTAGGLGQAATVQCIWLCLVVGWLVAAPRLRWTHPAPLRSAPARATPLLASARRPSAV